MDVLVNPLEMYLMFEGRARSEESSSRNELSHYAAHSLDGPLLTWQLLRSVYLPIPSHCEQIGALASERLAAAYCIIALKNYSNCSRSNRWRPENLGLHSGGRHSRNNANAGGAEWQSSFHGRAPNFSPTLFVA